MWQRVPAEDDCHQEDQDDQGDEIAKHDPGREGEGVHDEVVEEDGKEGGEDVDEADVEDDGGAGEGSMEEVNSEDEAVEGKEKYIDDLIILYFIDQPVEGEKEAGATEHQGGEDQVVPVVRWMDVVDLGGKCSGDLLHPW